MIITYSWRDEGGGGGGEEEKEDRIVDTTGFPANESLISEEDRIFDSSGSQ